MSDLATTRK